MIRRLGDSMGNHNGDTRIRLDEIIKSLFKVSKKVLIEMMNSLFKENYDIENTQITFDNNEFVTDEFDIIRGDLFLKIINNENPYHYHIELQTKNDRTMIIRMFEYGLAKAKELAKYENDDELVIYIPKQLVIFIEQNNNIKDELKMRLVFPDGDDVQYRVPVMKYWEYDDKKLIREKMYPLLPLQVFKLRYKMDNLKKKNNSQNQIIKTVLEAKHISETIAKEAKILYDQTKIDGDDLHKVLLAIANIFEYLNRKYGNDEKLEQEVFDMTRTLYDPTVEEKGKKLGRKEGIEEGRKEGKKEGIREGKKEVAKRMLLKGMDIELIAQITGLDVKTIKGLDDK